MAKINVRKQWQTPQVFVLGAEGTEAYQAGGKNEGAKHLVTQTAIISGVPVKIAGSDNLATGYES